MVQSVGTVFLNAGYVCLFPSSRKMNFLKQGCSGTWRWRDDVLPALDQLQLHHGWPVQEFFILVSFCFSKFSFVLVSTYVGLSSPAWIAAVFACSSVRPKTTWHVEYFKSRHTSHIIVGTPALCQSSSPGCSSSPPQTCSICESIFNNHIVKIIFIQIKKIDSFNNLASHAVVSAVKRSPVPTNAAGNLGIKTCG